MIEVPCIPRGEAQWTQRTTLAGVDYLLTFQWIQRDGHWSLDVADQDGVAIVSGLSLVLDLPLLSRVVDARRPPGELFCIDTSGVRDLDPGFDDLGARFTLLYLDPGEF